MLHITQHNIYSFENVHLKIIVYILEDMATISLASIASSNQVLVELEANNKKILETFDSTGYTNNLHNGLQHLTLLLIRFTNIQS